MIRRYIDDVRTNDDGRCRAYEETSLIPLWVLEQAASYEYKRCRQIRYVLKKYITHVKTHKRIHKRFDTDAFFARWCLTKKIQDKLVWDASRVSFWSSCFSWDSMFPVSGYLLHEKSMFDDELGRLGLDSAELTGVKRWLHAYIAQSITDLLFILRRDRHPLSVFDTTLPSLTVSHVDLSQTRCGNYVLRHPQERLAFEIAQATYKKVEALFWNNAGIMDARHRYPTIFLSRLYILLARYASLDGEGYQGTMNPHMMTHLRRNMGVSTECFASPLNVNALTPNYFSAFPLVDAVFGAQGSFFDKPSSAFGPGTYEVNPPFIEEIMYLVVLKVLDILNITARKKIPVRFCIFLPFWNDTPSVEYLRALEKERDTPVRFSKLMHKQVYAYLPGFHHLPARKNHMIHYASTYIFILQNNIKHV